MKKLIGSVSCLLVMGCALALANANDDVNANNNNGTSDMNGQSAMVHQEPGTAADSNNANGNVTTPDANSADKMNSESTTTTTTSKTSAMNKKSCTDSNGNVILKGHTGYKACVKANKDQMGGTADESLNKREDVHSDTSGTTDTQ
jgi:hypothetical protein